MTVKNSSKPVSAPTDILKILGSLYFALFLISTLTIILIVSTTLESIHGTPFVQRFFYQAGWFDIFLSLLAVNVVCSTILRLPFKKRHTGFVITHIGLLTVLAGSLLTRFLSVEGQMMLYEGESYDQIALNSYQLQVQKDASQMSNFDFDRLPRKTTKPLDASDPHLEFYTHRVVENASETLLVQEGSGADSPANHAIYLSLKSQRLGFHDSLWVIENNPLDPH